MNADALRADLQRNFDGEVRFDRVSRALYSTDASVYRIHPSGVAVPRTREDLLRIVGACARHRCSLTMRGGGTSQAGQAIGPGLIVDTSKYFNRLLELNLEEQWARVEPGIVLDELNLKLRPHGLRFAPDVSTASRATVGGMMANNSSGARSVYYGKTIDHVLEQTVLLSDGSVVDFRPLSEAELEEKIAADTLEGSCYRTVQRLARTHAAEIELRYPKVLRRVGGYNLDEFSKAGRPFNMAKLMVGSEGTLGIVLEAKVKLVPLPAAKAVLAIQFADLLQALSSAPLILRHQPSAVEVIDKFILDYTKQNAAIDALRRSFIEGDPGALLCVEFYADRAEDLPGRLQRLEWDLRAHGFGYRYVHALDAGVQARIWSLREVALGLSMAMKDDAKSLSFVEDAAVAPEKLRDYIERVLAIVRRHGSSSGVYAHASVGCLHVRPVINLKTEDGIRRFEAIANEVSDLVIEFGGALSGEHGDGLVRSPFMEKMFGTTLYQAFREVKRTFDPDGLFNPGKIVDAPPLTANLRYGAGYETPAPATFFDYSDYGGMGGAVEMCSGLGVCRKTAEGTMCPSYMATREEAHSTRGRANVLRMAMTGRLGEAGLGDEGVHDVLDLCLECRACKAECPVGVDVARFKSEFLADYYRRHGTPLSARLLGNARALAQWGSRLAPLSNWAMRNGLVRRLAESAGDIDRRRRLPRFARRTLTERVASQDRREFSQQRRAGLQTRLDPDVLLFADTFTNYYEPDIGVAALEVLASAGVRAGLAAHGCCGRPQISKGLLSQARQMAEASTRALHEHAAAGRPILFCEPSCLSAMREDVPALLRGEARRRAEEVARSCALFEDYVETVADRLHFAYRAGPILLHGHCHQKSMGLVAPARALLSRVPGATLVDLDAGCCGMAGSFGYTRGHVDVSKAIGERKLFPALRAKGPDAAVVAAGTSCRHQVLEFTGIEAVHPAVFLRSLL